MHDLLPRRAHRAGRLTVAVLLVHDHIVAGGGRELALEGLLTPVNLLGMPDAHLADQREDRDVDLGRGGGRRETGLAVVAVVVVMVVLVVLVVVVAAAAAAIDRCNARANERTNKR